MHITNPTQRPPARGHRLAAACLLAGSISLNAQLEFSIQRPAAEPWSGADILLSNGSGVHLSAADLGLNATDEVNAFSFGDDEIEPLGTYNFSRVAYSVQRGSQGSGGAITAQARGNGAAGDIFQVSVVGYQGNFLNLVRPQLVSDAPLHNLTPAPSETELDGLSLVQPGSAGFPIYFTLRGHPTRGPADILMVAAPGAVPQTFATAAQLGLVAGDEIDALAIGTIPHAAGPPAALGANVVIWVSLTRVSPSGTIATAAGGDGIIQVYPGAHQLVMDANVLGLDPADELDAISGLDPGLAERVCNPENGNCYSALAVEGGITFDDAMRVAEALEVNGVPGHLATITTQQEQEFLVASFPDACNNGFYLGGVQAAHETVPALRWNWITGEPWNFVNWPTFEPNDYGGVNERFLAFHGYLGSNPNGFWNDVQSCCAAGFLVEWEKGNQCPVAVINSDATRQDGRIKVIAPNHAAPVTVTLDASQSSDADGHSLSYRVTVDGLQISTEPIVSVQLGVGSHTASLTVDDGRCIDTETVSIEVQSPSQAVDGLNDQIQASDSPQQTKLAADALLRAAGFSFDKNCIIPATHQLNAFKLVVTHQLPSAEAQNYTATADEIKAATAGSTGDLNGDGRIDGTDFSLLKDAVRSGSTDLNLDVNLDGEVSTSDLNALRLQFTR